GADCWSATNNLHHTPINTSVKKNLHIALSTIVPGVCCRMAPNPEHVGKQFTKKQVALLLSVLGSVLIIILVGVALLHGPSGQPTTVSPSPTPPSTVALSPRPTSPVSPLIFGTNMSLFASASTDQMLDSPATQKALQQIHVQIIRMPIRPGVPEALEIKAAQAIKQIGADRKS